MHDPRVTELLSQIDILIDGRYQETNKANLIWRGSKNQRVHFLTERYREYQSKIDFGGEIELVIGNDRIRFTGMIQEDIIRHLNDIVKKREK